jgi:hypothetical protein
MRRAGLAAGTLATLLLAGCGHASGGSRSAEVRTLPDIQAFLRDPVATPSSCPATDAQSTGLRSPWAGHVDVSVFLTRRESPAWWRLGRYLEHVPIVKAVYFESPKEAYQEFQRLYTCWAQVPRSQTPASFRVVLIPTATIGQRDALVARLLRRPEVDTVSCDPSLPCVDVVRSASAHG